jgi:hypothetical protein
MDLIGSMENEIQPLLEEYFIDYDEKVEYYIGLPNYNVLMAVFRFLENHIPITDINSLSKLQQLILTLIKLRLSLLIHIISYTVKPRFIAPRFTAKLAYRQEFLQSRFPYVVITPLKCQTRIPSSATVIKDQTVNLRLFKPRS